MGTSGRRRVTKERIYSLLAQPAGALANPHRLELIDLLAQAPRTVEELSAEANMSVANTSQHLQRLKQARLVGSEREARRVRYRLADPAVARLWMNLRSLGRARLPEVEQAVDAYRDRRHAFETFPAREVRAAQRRGEIALIDVRPAVEYEAGHLPGAISVPLAEIKDHLERLPRGKKAVAYCRGPYCVYADDALAFLAQRGWRVARLEEGVLEWQESGLPLKRNVGITPA